MNAVVSMRTRYGGHLLAHIGFVADNGVRVLQSNQIEMLVVE